MGDINPNPSGWSRSNIFVDLDQVVWASFDGEYLKLLFKQDANKDPRVLARFSEDAWNDLRNALLIYRSHR